MNLDHRLLKYLLKHKRSFAVSIGLSLVAGIAVIMQAGLLSRIIDSAFPGGKDLHDVLPVMLLFLAFTLLRALSHWGGKSASISMAAAVKSDIRKRLSSHLFRLGPVALRRQETGELKNTLTAGVQSLDAYFSEYLPQLLLAVLIPGLILIFVFPVDLLSGFVFLITAPLIPIFMILIGDIAQALTKKQWTLLSRMNGFFLDALQGLTMLKILGRSRDYAEKIRVVTEEFRSTTIKVLRVAFLSALALEVLSTISTAIIAVEIGLRLLYAKMTFGQAMFILILAPEFYQPLRQLGPRFHAGMEGFVAAKRIFEILQEKPLASPSHRIFKSEIDKVSFQGVSFSYPGSDNPALVDIRLNIERGQKIALVGPSGAGKSTLVSLLLRFIDPTSGDIYVNEQPLRDSDAAQWRRRIAWAPQDPFLFHASVLENIRMGDERATQADIERAARRAHAHDFIQTLPQGYETIIGERGARLSGGQAQRLALARAFLKDAPLLILDEPTSHLDEETEALVQSSFAELTANRTVIAIAHRLHTVRNADEIIVLKEGRIVERGRHDELLHRDGLYARLVRSQELRV